MRRVAEGLYLLALVLWVGGAAMFTFVVAPAVFQALPTEQAGRVVGAIFPTYYALGTVCGVVLLVAGVWLFRQAPTTALKRSLMLVVLMLACNGYGGFVIHPHAAQLKAQMRVAETSEQRAEFRRLHGTAMGLNAIVLLAGFGLVALAAGRISGLTASPPTSLPD